jgi:hypothetical protein
MKGFHNGSYPFPAILPFGLFSVTFLSLTASLTFEERLRHSQGANINADTSNANKFHLKACRHTCARGYRNVARKGFPERRNVGPTIQSVASVSIENRLKESSHREKALNVSFVDPFALSPNVSLELQSPHDGAPVGSSSTAPSIANGRHEITGRRYRDSPACCRSGIKQRLN